MEIVIAIVGSLIGVIGVGEALRRQGAISGRAMVYLMAFCTAAAVAFLIANLTH